MLGAVATDVIRRPKLSIYGYGSGGVGGSEEVRYFYLGFMNRSLLVGLNVRETTFWGHHLWADRERGIALARTTAPKCSAFLVDASTGRSLSGLYWRDPTHPSELTGVIDIEPDIQYQLMVMARISTDPSSYFPWQPDPKDPARPVIPANVGKISGSHDFEIHVNLVNGRRKQRFRFRMEQTIDGRLLWHVGKGRRRWEGGGSF